MGKAGRQSLNAGTAQQDREARIRQRAHELWEGEGRPEGRSDEHWERATAEVDREIAAAAEPAGSVKSNRATATGRTRAKAASTKVKAAGARGGRRKAAPSTEGAAEREAVAQAPVGQPQAGPEQAGPELAATPEKTTGRRKSAARLGSAWEAGGRPDQASQDTAGVSESGTTAKKARGKAPAQPAGAVAPITSRRSRKAPAVPLEAAGETPAGTGSAGSSEAKPAPRRSGGMASVKSKSTKTAADQAAGWFGRSEGAAGAANRKAAAELKKVDAGAKTGRGKGSVAKDGADTPARGRGRTRAPAS